MARIIKAETIEQGGAEPGAVLNLADLAAEARSIILDARKDAARIVAEARVVADGVCDQAAEKGYAEGLARGRNDGYAEGHKQGLDAAAEEFASRARGLTETAERIVQELAAARAELLHRARCEMLDFALELASKVVGRVAAGDAGAARENLRKVLELAPCAPEVCVKVHPSQVEALRLCLPALAEALGRTGQVRLVGDEGISPGGVKLLSPRGEIDATIETQLSNIAEALLGTDAGERFRRAPAAAVGRYDPVGGSDGEPLDAPPTPRQENERPLASKT